MCGQQDEGMFLKRGKDPMFKHTKPPTVSGFL